jgi:hypothetical protein
MKEYKRIVKYDWEKQINPSTDPFMQRFDENGNFVNLPTRRKLLYLILAVTTFVVEYIENKKRTRAGALVRFFMITI